MKESKAFEFVQSSFSILDTSIPDNLIETLFSQWGLFFSSEEKFDFERRPGSLAGYFKLGEETAVGVSQADPKEYFHFYEGGVCPDQLTLVTLGMFKACRSLAVGMAIELDRLRVLPHKIADAIQHSPRLVLRILNYRGSNGIVDLAAKHTDINLFTLIPGATAAGLTVFSRDGAPRPINLERGHALIMAGDMLEALSCGNIKATHHQVTSSKDHGHRMSVVFFANPPDEFELADGLTAGQMLRRRLAEMSKRDVQNT